MIALITTVPLSMGSSTEIAHTSPGCLVREHAQLLHVSEAPAHGGGLNACGCHFNRKTGECHYHQPRGCGCECQPASCN